MNGNQLSRADRTLVRIRSAMVIVAWAALPGLEASTEHAGERGQAADDEQPGPDHLPDRCVVRAACEHEQPDSCGYGQDSVDEVLLDLHGLSPSRADRTPIWMTFATPAPSSSIATKAAAAIPAPRDMAASLGGPPLLAREPYERLIDSS